jgi:alkanesulfonate monooxygenase SsuD/methylene tetrahydromethanopterin reductase-like flavin-dependent oxidoreductase (luciferase family)
MGARVSTLLNVGPQGGRYVFLLIEWNDYAYPVRAELNRQAEAFGMDLGPYGGVLVQAYPQRMYEIAQEVVDKPWPSEINERFRSDQDPIILILDRDWKTFDPREHPYGIIWVSEFADSPEEVRPLLQQLALRSRRGDDLITYLHNVAIREQQAATLDRAQNGIRLLARIASYVEIKPSVFGVAIDVKAILRDISERHH